MNLCSGWRLTRTKLIFVFLKKSFPNTKVKPTNSEFTLGPRGVSEHSFYENFLSMWICRHLGKKCTIVYLIANTLGKATFGNFSSIMNTYSNNSNNSNYSKLPKMHKFISLTLPNKRSKYWQCMKYNDAI